MNMVKFIPEYEAMTGEKVSPVVAWFAEKVDIVGHRFEVKGCRDATQGLPVPSVDAFLEWSKKLTHDDAEMLETVADLLRLYYMDGYRKGGDA